MKRIDVPRSRIGAPSFIARSKVASARPQSGSPLRTTHVPPDADFSTIRSTMNQRDDRGDSARVGPKTSAGSLAPSGSRCVAKFLRRDASYTTVEESLTRPGREIVVPLVSKVTTSLPSGALLRSCDLNADAG